MTRHLPRPVTANDEFMAVAVELLDEQNRLLAEILDRLPATTLPPGGGGQPASHQPPTPEPDPDPQLEFGPFEVSEPAPKRTPTKRAPRRAKPSESETE